jgi:quinol monooxygenase YgiN
MYGTIAKIHTHPSQVEALRALAERMGTAPGQLGRYVYQMDADPGELFLVAIFESRQAYWENAQSPEQHQRFQELRALLDSDPEWHDGEIIDAAA